MTPDELRREMEGYRLALEQEAKALKDTYVALDRLHALYQRLDRDEREMADQVLVEWVLSDDESLRFDALALIDDFKISSAVPALKRLAMRLTSSNAPGGPYELQKVNRIARHLTDHTAG